MIYMIYLFYDFFCYIDATYWASNFFNFQCVSAFPPLCLLLFDSFC